MPYRRLPNTDLARLHALHEAARRAQEADFNEQVLPYKMLSEIQRFLVPFENAVMQSKDNYETKVNANKQYRHVVQNARMYISHFIQVLNLAVIRGEIKKEQKLLYGLDPHNHIVPDLASEENLLEWGKKIIEGEQKRMANGGFPIYNPAINKVKVHYDIFCEHQRQHVFHVQNTERVHGDLEPLRAKADAIIVEVWNQVEKYYSNLLPYAKMLKCQMYGVIYYYRKGEKKLSAESDRELQRMSEIQPTIQWSGED
ncbi:MAG: hypothetical protein K6A36_05805 [Paludibacteraceae bacterium]|nr:hypothetical protein [Paludibacteraceae bacterium]